MVLYLFGGVLIILTLAHVALAIRLERNITRYRIRKNYTAAIDAPSVSVCIPARNEMHAVAECLERVLASDYKKMEVLVYDDSSADNTSVIVRSFAHAGVRFVEGADLPDGWLGKSHALEVLRNEASGTYVIFMDVDTLIAPTTISRLVGYFMTEKATVVSAIPGKAGVVRASTLFGHLRYFWEVLLSSRLRPATSSALWMIGRSTLVDYGGFTKAKSYVAPEVMYAEMAHRTHTHRTLLGSLDIVSEKKWTSQVETSRRLLYPRLMANFTQGLLSLSLLAILLAPQGAIVYGGVIAEPWISVIGVWFVAVQMACYMLYASVIWRQHWWLAGIFWPILILQELVMLLQSYIAYQTDTVTWKGRSVPRAIKRHPWA